jgi:hypothetical protein
MKRMAFKKETKECTDQDERGYRAKCRSIHFALRGCNVAFEFLALSRLPRFKRFNAKHEVEFTPIALR